MDRFDSMRAKKIIGGGNGNYSSLGTPITVETRNSFNAGDRFVGVKNDGHVAQTIVSAQLAAENLAVASDDLAVCVMSQSITNNSSSLRIGFLNKETNEYEIYDVSLPTMTFAASFTLNNTNTTINEDGSLIAIYNKDAKLAYSSYNAIGILIINVDVENKRASAVYRGDYYKFGEYHYTTGNNTYDVVDSSIYHNNISFTVLATGNYLLIASCVKITYYDSTGAIKAALLAFNSLYEATKTIPLHKIAYNSSYLRPFLSCAWRSSDTLIATIQSSTVTSFKGIIIKYKVNGATLENASYVEKGDGAAISTTVKLMLSANGKYMAEGATTSWTVYSINSDLSLNHIGSATFSASQSYCYPDNTGTQFISTNGSVFNLSENKTFVYWTSTLTASSRHFDLKTGFFRSGNKKVFLSPQSSEPEYIISNTQAYIEIADADRVYGIVPKDMVTGEIGTAQALFET